MGKISAIAIVHLLQGKEPPVIPPVNTCYSWGSDQEAIAVVNAYRIEQGKVVQIEQKLTPGKEERRSPGDAGLKETKALMKAIPDETLGDFAAYYSSLR